MKVNKKGIISLITIGLLSSPLSLGTVYAKENQYEISEKTISRQVEMKKTLNENILDSSKFTRFKESALNPLKDSHSFMKVKDKGLRIMSSNAASDEPLYEMEYNDDFDNANSLPFDKAIVGQFLPMYDVDMFKVNVPTRGLLFVYGSTNSNSIDLGFGALEKDFKDNGNLQYLGYKYENNVEIQAYKVNKAGTYYIAAIDQDNAYGLDDNTEYDMYGIMASFVDNVAPYKPVVNKVDNNDKVITGKSEANSTVTVKAGNKVIGTAKATSKETFSVNIPVQKEGTKLTITAKDAAGNVSPSVTITVLDVIPPSKPIVNRVDSNDRVVTGRAEAYSKVEVKVGTKLLGSANANSKGSFSVKINPQKIGTILTITAKDKAGNISQKATTQVVKP
jgi:hypothetical protein